MAVLIDLTLTSLTLTCLLSSLYFLHRIKRLKENIIEKKIDIQTNEEHLWQINTDLSRSILTKLRLLDRLSSSQV